MTDKYLKASQSKGDLPWNDLRSRKTWDRLKERIGQSNEQAEPLRGVQLKWLVYPALGVMMIGLVVLLKILLIPGEGSSRADEFMVAKGPLVPLSLKLPTPKKNNFSTIRVASHDGVSVMTLFDGSKVMPAADARFKLVSGSLRRIEVEQSRGRISYEVTRRPMRKFVVKAHGVMVVVLGTKFSLDIGEKQVVVRVTRGRVRASDSQRQVMLMAGESVTLLRNVLPSVIPGQGVDKGAPGAQKRAPSKRVSTMNKGAPPVPKRGVASLKEVLRQVDTARRSGKIREAVLLLRHAVKSYPSDPNRTMAFFLLAKMEFALGNYGAAAHAYRSYLKVSPSGTFAMDALAGEAKSRKRCGQKARARALAKTYLRLYPKSLHAAEMRSITRE